MRQSRTMLGVALALALGAVMARAGDPPSRPPPKPPAEALGAIRDMRLTVQAKRALSRDPDLGRLSLGVQVREGVAVVWGDVPSAAVARQVTLRLEAIDGIHDVRSEMRDGRGAELARAPELSVPDGVPRQLVRVEAAKPDVKTGTIRPRATPVAGDGVKAVRPGTSPPLRPVVATEPAVEVPPAAVRQRAPLPPPAPPRRGEEQKAARAASEAGGLEEAVGRVKASQARYRGIPVRVVGDVVVVSRRGADDEVVLALVQALRRVNGVSQVRLVSD